MVTIGADCHLKTTTFSVRDHQGTRIMRKKVINDPQEITAFIRQFEGRKQFAMEATYTWPIFYSLCKNEVDEFHLLNPRKLKAITSSQSKTDAHDADQLSYLTHIGYVPESYKADPDTQLIRKSIRTRVNMSRTMTGIKNQIHAIINTHVFYSQRPQNFKSFFCKRGMEYLRTVPVPEKARMLLDHLLKELIYIKTVQSSLDVAIQKTNFKEQESALLETVPGMRGKVFKYIILSEIDSIERFRNARALVAYAGLIPKERSSGEKIRKGRLRTDANEFLKWALLESVYSAILKDPGLKQYYKETKERLNASSAKIATARKLLTSIYHVLREKRPYFPVATVNSSHFGLATP